MKFVDLNSARSSMFIALSHYRSGAVRRGRTNYMIDSGAHSAPPSCACGRSDVAINMAPLQGATHRSTPRLQQTAAVQTEGHQRKPCPEHTTSDTPDADE